MLRSQTFFACFLFVWICNFWEGMTTFGEYDPILAHPIIESSLTLARFLGRKILAIKTVLK